MTTVLYIHGFNGNPKGGTFEGLVEFFKSKTDYQVISFPFPDLHLDVQKTQKQIENYIDENNVSILVGASLGGFYTLCCKKNVFKIAINPCMLPSKEIPILKDRNTGKPVFIEDSVLNAWKSLEEYDLPANCKNAAGIFGKQDYTFHYDENHNFKPLFDKLFSINDSKDSASSENPKKRSVLVEGVHSLEPDQLKDGLEQIFSNLGL
ncbi:MAG: hypothetical protein MJ188_00950 [Treponema sp.]|nr:hypothetical protein [Treponema sp.]